MGTVIRSRTVSAEPDLELPGDDDPRRIALRSADPGYARYLEAAK